ISTGVRYRFTNVCQVGLYAEKRLASFCARFSYTLQICHGGGMAFTFLSLPRRVRAPGSGLEFCPRTVSPLSTSFGQWVSCMNESPGLRLALAASAFLLAAPLAAQTPEETARAALAAAPVWDGHNDVPIQLRARFGNVIGD